MLSHRLIVAAILMTLLPGSAPGYPDEAAVLAELNAMRADPPAYAAKLSAFRRLFPTPEAKFYLIPGDPVMHMTNEGVGAIDEAIAALSKRPPLGTLAPAPLLGRAARDFVEEQGPTGAIGHRSQNGDGPGDRVKRRGGDIYIAETISYGANSATEVIRQLIVDDGVASRGHRAILLSPEYRVAGIWCGPHARYGAMCVLDFSVSATGSYHPG
ncbi:CAP domain-containing protein [Sphingomonas sp. ERG5]|uniref:CAP domain-containing protein n=1 Tax=Sphingomonas sp. ERG5 TaxID=1381597 RepID=UPI00054BBEDF|nr:CAP domain-containing protein [Sphingomonas sp. ERG5]